MKLTLENCIAVLEAYSGKDKDLLRAEKLLDVMCKKIIENEGNLDGISFAGTKELKEVENILKKKFKAKQFTLHIYDDLITNTIMGSNGFTIPQGLASFRPKEDGLSSGLCIYVSLGQGLISHMKMTGGEAMAIVLHEIGHNVRRDWLRQFNDIIMTALMPQRTIMSELLVSQSMYIIMPKDLEKNSGSTVMKVSKLIRKIQRWISDITKIPYFVNTLSIISKNPGVLLNIIDPTTYITGYIEEKYADSLPTRFGYGYEMATAAAKMDDFRRSSLTNMKPSPISIVEDFLIRSTAILLSPADVHPMDSIRVARQITLMKKHLNDPSITKEQRKELEESLINLERFLDEVYLNPKHKRNMAAPFTFVWNLITVKLKGYVDIREIFNILRLEE